MAEDREENDTLLAGLGDDDIITNVYEGGLKSWECSVDLVKVLLEEINNGNESSHDGVYHIVELGCGTALPTLALIQDQLLCSHHRTHFTVADYNYDVLRLVTVPNLLLSWYRTTKRSVDWSSEDDLEITPELLENFIATLQERDITIEAISGAWSPHFIELLSNKVSPSPNVLVLGSETIYSPASIRAFTKVLVEILIQGEASRALVAAKSIYFGVGGSVDEFRAVLTECGGMAREVEGMDGWESQGVTRVILEVRRE
ncbi:MAG: hypothetical protein M1827_006997 [Pycnora praestabilis]|nr:MAG: hypothetical protein M1827_006997 [Pycnora praestabilis]